MKSGYVLAGAVAAALAGTSPLAAQKPIANLTLVEGPLARALTDLAAQAGVEILFDARLVADRRAPAISGPLTVDRALERLLTGSGLGFRRTADGAFVLVAGEGSTALLDVGAYPEILVVGRLSQNTDIRRTDNDIQPYKVTGRREVAVANRQSVEEFVRSRVPANAQTRALAQDLSEGAGGAVRSQIDLRGLGANRTLVLIDGRRLPSVPSLLADFEQPDLNGVPLSAIERIETLTGTAGGIYGPGALGGVMNVVLRRDYRGADLILDSLIDERGDAARLRIEGRLGVSPNDGRTGIMLLAAHQVSSPLLFGDRDYSLDARRRQLRNDPAAYAALQNAANAVTITASNGNLRLRPELGGGTALGTATTFLPVDFAGTRDEAAALLRANAGATVLDLPKDGSGTERYLVANPTVTSGLASARHEITDGIEAFVDGLYYRNRGEYRSGEIGAVFFVNRTAPTNPFDQAVSVRFPLPSSTALSTQTSDVGRLTVGGVARLPGEWSIEADYTTGFARLTRAFRGRATDFAYSLAVARGRIGSDGRPLVDPFGLASDRLAATEAYLVETTTRLEQKNHFNTVSARLAGPVAQLPHGPLALTALLERRRERVPASQLTQTTGGDRQVVPAASKRAQTVKSAYAELRAPLLGDTAILPVRDLELQLTARYDWTTTTFPQIQPFSKAPFDELNTARGSALTYTFGAKVAPIPALMFRASIATGRLPPTSEQLTTESTRLDNSFVAFNPADPKRGGRRLGSEGPVDVSSGGNSDIASERARTLSVGFVLNPETVAAPRFSVDYSRIDKRREVSAFPLDANGLVLNEATFADRVSRAPLSDADAARGFTGGQITALDLRAFNGGRTKLDAVDFDLDWTLPFQGGEARLYGSATWQPRFSQRGAGGQFTNRVGYIDGPLEWRGHAGVEWTRGPLLIDLNAQYFDGYRVILVSQDPSSATAQRIVRLQGSARIPAQAYLDLAVRRRFALSETSALEVFELGFGIQNLLDHRPPTVAVPDDIPYSAYGDPRRRRFTLTLAAEF